MIEPGLHPVEDIERLELRIEALQDSIARSRRLMLAGRVGAAIGPLLLVALMFGLIVFTPARVLMALAGEQYVLVVVERCRGGRRRIAHPASLQKAREPLTLFPNTVIAVGQEIQAFQTGHGVCE